MPRLLNRLAGFCPAHVEAIHKLDPSLASQGYHLDVSPTQIAIASSTEQGAFYAHQTLVQVRRQFPKALPAIHIEDSPDFVTRGIMLDISRDKVPTLATLLSLIDLFAELKINQLQLYTEHTFAYRNHQEVWENASPITADEIRELDRYCKARFIDLVPNQNSFGHMERWLKHPRYESLAECPEGFTFPWGYRHPGGFSLNPADPRSLRLIEELFDELLPNFSSRFFNVGCDETFDLGLGKSKALCEEKGKHRVYLDFLLKIHELTKKHKRTMQFWGDIILHEPELIKELPRDLIALNWGYESDHPFEKETAAFRDAKVPFYVAPGTSSWCSFTGRLDNAISNLKRAAASGLANGAIGYLNTDWGDIGHLQYLPISYPGVAAGAAYSWCLESNEDLDLARAMDLHIFKDPARVVADVLIKLGNVYQFSQPLANGSRIFWSLVGDAQRKKLYEPLTLKDFDDTEGEVREALSPLDSSRMQREDAQLIEDELRNNAKMVLAGCLRGRLRVQGDAKPSPDLTALLSQTIEEHRRLWLSRNREGGLPDSVGRLEVPMQASRPCE